MKRSTVFVVTVLLVIGAGEVNQCLAQPTIVWQKTYGSSSREIAQDIQPTKDGGFILTGDTGTFHVTNRDYWLVKLDGSGNISWHKTLGDAGDDFHSHSVKQTSDDGYIVIGNTNSTSGELGVYKLDNSGSFAPPNGWHQNYGDATSDYGNNDIKPTTLGYILCGNVNSNSGQVTGFHPGATGVEDDAWIVTLKPDGTIDWKTTLGGSGYDVPNSVLQTADGGYIMAGATNSTDGDITGKGSSDNDMWVVKWQANKALEWKTTFGGSGEDWANCIIQQASDGSYLVFGTTWSGDFFGSTTGNILAPGGHHTRTVNDGDGDYCLAKIDKYGKLLWAKNYGGSGEDWGMKVITTCDGGYLMIGQSNSTDGDVTGNHGANDYWLIRTDADGTLMWEKSLGGSGDDIGTAICQIADGSILVAGGSASNDGDVTNNHGDYDYWVVKLTEASINIDLGCSGIFLKGRSYDFSATVINNTCKATSQFQWTVTGQAAIKTDIKGVGIASEQDVTIKMNAPAKGKFASVLPYTIHLCVSVTLGTNVLTKCIDITVRNEDSITLIESYIDQLNCFRRVHIPPNQRWPLWDIWGPPPRSIASTLSDKDFGRLESITSGLAKEVKAMRESSKRIDRKSK